MAIAEKLSKIWVSPTTLLDGVADDTTGRGVNSVADDTIETIAEVIQQTLAQPSTESRIREIRTIPESPCEAIARNPSRRHSYDPEKEYFDYSR